MATPPTKCRVCGTTWTGLATCHCSRCHVTFTAVTAFDMHQTHDKTRCTNPAKSKKFSEYRPGVFGQAYEGAPRWS